MTIAQGVFKQTVWRRQAAKGTLATAGGGGQVLRRNTSVFELQRESYDGNAEIASHQQASSMRLGTKLVNGSVAGLLHPGTHSDILSAILRRDFAAVTASTGVSLTIAGAGPTYTLTRAAGSWLTDAYKVGMVVRLSVGALNAANLAKNLMITAIGSATVMTVMPVNGVALVAEGPVATCTITATGKVTYAPATGHTKIYYTIEEWYPEITHSERNQDVRFGNAQIAMPGSGNSTIQLTAQGLDQSVGTAAYFSAAVAEAATQAAAAATGVLMVNGVQQATVTDLQMTINGNQAPADGVVGGVVRPDIFTGKVAVSGQFTCYFEGPTTPNLFLNETEISICTVLTTDTTAASEFIALCMPRLKLTTSTPDDAETGLKRTYQFTALYNSTGGAGIATEKTTIQVQDSLAA